MSSLNRTRALAVLVMTGSLLVSACMKGPRGGGEKDEEASAPIPVEVASARVGDVFATYSGTAALEAEEEAQVVAKVGGEVVAIAVEEGDQVKAGDVLARLDGDRLRLELERSRANLQKLEQDYTRNVDLYEKGLVSSGAYEGMKFELEALRSAYRLAQLELSYTVIRAPIDGVIAERQIKVGNTITANTPVFRITDLDPLLAYLHVPEKEFRKLAAGQAAMLRVDALPTRDFTARVARISPVIDPDSGTFKVTLEVGDDGNVLKPGMFGRFAIVFDRRSNALLIPRSALLRDDDESAVFVVNDGVAERRVVATGYSQGGDLEIVSGLTAEDDVVVVGQAGLADGNEVRIVNLSEPASDTLEAATPDSALAADQAGG